MAKAKRKDQSDYGTPESYQHGAFVLEETMVAGIKRRKNVEYDQLTKLLRRDAIDVREYTIGQEYGELCYRACLAGLPKCANLNKQPGKGDSEKKHKALQAIRQAETAIGPTATNVLRAVCVDGFSPSEWETAMGFPARHSHGVVFLKDALRCLGEFWKR